MKPKHLVVSKEIQKELDSKALSSAYIKRHRKAEKRLQDAKAREAGQYHHVTRQQRRKVMIHICPDEVNAFLSVLPSIQSHIGLWLGQMKQVVVNITNALGSRKVHETLAKWEPGLPTEPGFYYVRRNGELTIRQIELHMAEGKLWSRTASLVAPAKGTDVSQVRSSDYQWSGPLPRPPK